MCRFFFCSDGQTIRRLGFVAKHSFESSKFAAQGPLNHDYLTSSKHSPLNRRYCSFAFYLFTIDECPSGPRTIQSLANDRNPYQPEDPSYFRSHTEDLWCCKFEDFSCSKENENIILFVTSLLCIVITPSLWIWIIVIVERHKLCVFKDVGYDVRYDVEGIEEIWIVWWMEDIWNA